MKVLNIHLKNYDSQYCGKDLMSLEEVVLCMNGKYVPFSAKVFGIDRELQPHFSEDTVEARIELKEKVSIFDNPRWVTFDKSKDLIGCFLDTLVDGKDYKVVETKVLTTGDKTYTLENGVRANEGYFHKVTPQDLLPDEDSFDNLVYVEPKHIGNNTYYVVEKDKLSENQWEFLLGNIPLDHEPEDNETYLNLDPDSRNWFGDICKSENQDIYISFNDLFQEVNIKKYYNKGDKLTAHNTTTNETFTLVCPQDKMCSAMLKRYCGIVLEKCEPLDKLIFIKQ